MLKQLAILGALAFAGAASATNTTQSGKLVFNPSLIDLQPDVTGTKVMVSLSEQAKSGVTVQFETNAMVRVDKCSLSFGPGQPHQHQITVYPAGALSSDTKSVDTELCSRIADSPYGKTDRQCVKINRTFKKAGICQSNADPHYRTFDDTPFTFMGTAETWYYLMKSESTTIQTKTIPVPGAQGTSNGNIAIRHWDGVLLLDITTEQKQGISPYTSRVIGNEKVFSSVKRSTNEVEAFLLDGSSVRVTYQFNRFWYADIIVQAPGFYMKKTEGLCGDFDGQKEDEQKCVKEGDKWKVPSDDCYHTNPKAPSIKKANQVGLECRFTEVTTSYNKTITPPPPSPSPSPPGNYTQPPSKPNPPPPTYNNTTPPSYNNTKPPPPAPPTYYNTVIVKKPVPVYKNETTWKQYCAKIFEVVTCKDNILSKASYISNCAHDCEMVGGNSTVRQGVAVGHLNAYQEYIGYLAKARFAANDIEGSKMLQECGNVKISVPPPTQYSSNNNTVIVHEVDTREMYTGSYFYSKESKYEESKFEESKYEESKHDETSRELYESEKESKSESYGKKSMQDSSEQPRYADYRKSSNSSEGPREIKSDCKCCKGSDSKKCRRRRTRCCRKCVCKCEC